MAIEPVGPVQGETGHALQCMEIWGGNRSADEAISVPGFDVWVYSKPHGPDGHGGDIHYASMCVAGNISRFAVADVAGHGAGVSRLATTLRTLMRKHINTPDQSKFATALNAEFGELSDAGVFATAVLATYFAPTDDLIVVNAGHPRPLLLRAREDRWSLLEAGERAGGQGPGGLPLGIIEPTEYTQFATRLSPGDVVMIYTDSLMEARDSDGRMLGEQGLLGLARGLDSGSPQDMAAGLIRRVEAFQGGPEWNDDVTLLVLHHNGQRPSLSVGDRLRGLARLLGLPA